MRNIECKNWLNIFQQGSRIFVKNYNFFVIHLVDGKYY
jgi:hypothetical protein